jgi:hypothetical protein
MLAIVFMYQIWCIIKMIYLVILIMKKPESNQSDREKDVANTLATLRIENLRPSDSLALGLQDYIDGKKTTTDLLEEVKAKYVALRR